jgi:hypothetical protein
MAAGAISFFHLAGLGGESVLTEDFFSEDFKSPHHENKCKT